MIPSLFRTLSFAALIGTAAVVNGQESSGGNQNSTTIEQTLKEMSYLKNEELDYNFSPATDNFKVPVIFTGNIRPTDKAKSKFLAAWYKTGLGGNLPVSAERLFDFEILVTDGGKSYWFPVQSMLVKHFQGISSGSQIEICISAIGAIREELMIVVNGFSITKVESTA